MFSSFGPHWIDFSLLMAALLKLEITNSFLWLSLPVRSGSLTRIYYSKLYSLAHTPLLNVFSALKGTHFYILLVLLHEMLQLISQVKEYALFQMFYTAIFLYQFQVKVLGLSFNHFIEDRYSKQRITFKQSQLICVHVRQDINMFLYRRRSATADIYLKP